MAIRQRGLDERRADPGRRRSTVPVHAPVERCDITRHGRPFHSPRRRPLPRRLRHQSAGHRLGHGGGPRRLWLELRGPPRRRSRGHGRRVRVPPVVGASSGRELVQRRLARRSDRPVLSFQLRVQPRPARSLAPLTRRRRRLLAGQTDAPRNGAVGCFGELDDTRRLRSALAFARRRRGLGAGGVGEAARRRSRGGSLAHLRATDVPTGERTTHRRGLGRIGPGRTPRRRGGRDLDGRLRRLAVLPQRLLQLEPQLSVGPLAGHAGPLRLHILLLPSLEHPPCPRALCSPS